MTRTMEDREDEEDEGTVVTRGTTPVPPCPGELSDVNLAEELRAADQTTVLLSMSPSAWTPGTGHRHRAP